MDTIVRALTVLIVDDSSFSRGVARRVLDGLGISGVHEAENGRKAIEWLSHSNNAVDVVFCDLLMPDMDGVEFLRHAAELPRKPIIVFVSGAGSSLLNTAEDTARARQLRVLGVIEKPLTPAEVQRVLGRFDAVSQKPPVVLEESGPQITPDDIDKALEEDEFVLHFQPKVSMQTEKLVGLEALVRWTHGEHGVISPGSFIPLAEESGKIADLTDRITMLALKQSGEWTDAGLETKLSINLSAYMLVDLALPDRLEAEAKRLNIDPQQIVLEVTETGLFQDAANTLEILARLHMKGFPLSIDDFGTGYSSMAQLRRIPFSEMKIDRAFVHDVTAHPKSRAILESSAALGHRLNMTVVAEGVETQGDWDELAAANIDVVQGFYVAKPMPGAKVTSWVSSRS